MSLRYRYECPECGNFLEFRMRVALRKRRCPVCGTEVTTREIDRQEREREVQAARELRAMERKRQEEQRIWAEYWNQFWMTTGTTLGIIAITCVVSLAITIFGCCVFGTVAGLLLPPPISKTINTKQ